MEQAMDDGDSIIEFPEGMSLDPSLESAAHDAALMQEELKALQEAPRSGLARLRYSHHQVARLLTQGWSHAEIALVTGYAVGTISVLKADPTFKELLSTYKVERDLAFADVLERMKTAGLSALEELQERLNTEPEKWTKRELMEMVDLMLVKARQGGSRPELPGGGIAIAVSFVTPQAAGASPSTIDLEVNHQ